MGRLYTQLNGKTILLKKQLGNVINYLLLLKIKLENSNIPKDQHIQILISKFKIKDKIMKQLKIILKEKEEDPKKLHLISIENQENKKYQISHYQNQKILLSKDQEEGLKDQKPKWLKVSIKAFQILKIVSHHLFIVKMIIQFIPIHQLKVTYKYKKIDQLKNMLNN